MDAHDDKINLKCYPENIQLTNYSNEVLNCFRLDLSLRALGKVKQSQSCKSLSLINVCLLLFIYLFVYYCPFILHKGLHTIIKSLNSVPSGE